MLPPANVPKRFLLANRNNAVKNGARWAQSYKGPVSNRFGNVTNPAIYPKQEHLLELMRGRFKSQALKHKYDNATMKRMSKPTFIHSFKNDAQKRFVTARKVRQQKRKNTRKPTTLPTVAIPITTAVDSADSGFGVAR